MGGAGSFSVMGNEDSVKDIFRRARAYLGEPAQAQRPIVPTEHLIHIEDDEFKADHRRALPIARAMLSCRVAEGY
jgi:hypothetical protein